MLITFASLRRTLLVCGTFRRYIGTSQFMAHHAAADDRLAVFGRVCDEIAAESSYIAKANILNEFFRKGNDGDGFKGDILLWVHMLIPSISERVYNLQNKQMLKLFSRILSADAQDMHLDLEQEGDVSETLRKYFERSTKLKPQAKSMLYLQEVDEFLVNLEKKTKEDEQTDLLRQLCTRATAKDLKLVIRLIKQDLRINAKARHILDAFGPLAYSTFQSTRNLSAVVKQFTIAPSSPASKKSPKIAKKATPGGGVQIMTPVSPMLANACKSVEEAFKKSPSGLFAEVKYDGERVQIHKQGKEFKFFSRNLKPVMDHKVRSLKEFIPKAFPGGENMILDSEIILVDTVTGDLLPFGTLGAHKKKEHEKAEICMFVFDCILFNDEDLTNVSLRERRKILESHLESIQYHVQLSESQFLTTPKELATMTAKVLQANLEGVVLKNPGETYKPGKRGWLKVKKDYLFGGKMADTADLVVLGAWYGSGRKGGVLSIFLMGSYDTADGLWKTVCKVHSGLDDATNDKVHYQLMALMERANINKLPTWLLCNRSLAPDFVAKSPKAMPVWEITGAEFTKSEAHTAGGVSIRFPRITKLRDDKSAGDANDVQHLKQLHDASKQNVNVDLLMASCADDADDNAITVRTKLTVTPKKPIKREINYQSDSKSRDDDQGSGGKKIKYSPINNNIITNPVKKEKIKQQTLNFSTQSNVKAEESALFHNIVAYFEGGLGVQRDVFVRNGGTACKDSRQADVIFHANEQMHGDDLSKFRTHCKKTSRHLSINWMHDSLKANQLKDHALYAVVLR